MNHSLTIRRASFASGSLYMISAGTRLASRRASDKKGLRARRIGASMDTEIKAAHRGMWIHSLAYHSKFDPLCATMSACNSSAPGRVATRVNEAGGDGRRSHLRTICQMRF